MVPGMMPGLTGVTGLTGLTGMDPNAVWRPWGPWGTWWSGKNDTGARTEPYKCIIFIHVCRFDLISVLPACFISGF
jgi:hypothetical protein